MLKTISLLPRNIFQTTTILDKQKFLEQLRSIPTNQTVVISDMLLTLTTHENLPETMRKEILDYLDKGGKLVIVSGDAIDVGTRILTNRLNYKGNKTLKFYMATQFGHEAWEIGVSKKSTVLKRLYTGNAMKPEVRNRMIEHISDLFKQIYGQSMNLTKKEWTSLTSTTGTQLEISKKFDLLKESCWLEVRPNKLTIVFPDKTISDNRKVDLLNRLYTNPDIQELLKSNGYHMVEPDGIYTEISTMNKRQGVEKFWQSREGRALNIADNYRIYTADSKNDRELYESESNTDGKAYKVFVGDHTDFFNRQLNPEQDPSFQIFENEYIDGTALVFNALNTSPR